MPINLAITSRYTSAARMSIKGIRTHIKSAHSRTWIEAGSATEGEPAGKLSGKAPRVQWLMQEVVAYLPRSS